MKKLLIFILICFSFSYELKEFVTCKYVKNHQPIDITSTFNIKDKKVYAFAYFKNIKKTHFINFIWEKYVNNQWNLYADIKLPIYKGYRWRTFSYINIRGDYYKGKWRVSIFDKNTTIAFKIFVIKKAKPTNKNKQH